MNPRLNPVDKLLGAATLLLLGLAGYWLGQPQQPFGGVAAKAQISPANPAPQLPATAEPPPADTRTTVAATDSADLRPTPSPDLATTPAPETTGPCQPRPLAFVSSPALRRRLLVRRYVGTVGGQPATALLQWHHPDSVTGRFYLHRGGPEYLLKSGGRHSGWRLGVEQNYPFEASSQGYWKLSGRPGVELRGSWTAGKRQQAILLREDYTGALRCGLETRLLAGGPAADSVTCHIPLYRRIFVTPLAPGSGPPALRAALVTTETARRHLMRTEREEDSQTSVWPEVRLNEHHLLSFQTILYADPFGGKPQHGIQSALYDLQTGQRLSIASQLLPGYEQPLRQLINQHLLHDPDFRMINENDFDAWSWLENPDQPNPLPPLPEQQPEHPYNAEYLALTGAGLEAYYSARSLLQDGALVPPMVLLVPYRELRPLVRPDTPLDRMLRARGL